LNSAEKGRIEKVHADIYVNAVYDKGQSINPCRGTNGKESLWQFAIPSSDLFNDRPPFEQKKGS